MFSSTLQNNGPNASWYYVLQQLFTFTWVPFLVGPQTPPPVTVKRRKLAWFRYVTRHDSLSKTILHGTLEGGRQRGRRGNAGWTASKGGHLWSYQNCSQGPSAKKTGRGSLLSRPSCHPDDPIGQVIELNWNLHGYLYTDGHSWTAYMILSPSSAPNEYILIKSVNSTVSLKIVQLVYVNGQKC